MLQEALYHVHHPSLAGQVERGVESSTSTPWPRGTVDVRSVPNQEAGGGRVVEEDGSVEESQLDPITATVPRVRVTPMNHLRPTEREQSALENT